MYLNIYSYCDTFLSNKTIEIESEKGEGGRAISKYRISLKHVCFVWLNAFWSSLFTCFPYVYTYWNWKMQVFNSKPDRAKSSALWKIQTHTHTYTLKTFLIVCDNISVIFDFIRAIHITYIQLNSMQRISFNVKKFSCIRSTEIMKRWEMQIDTDVEIKCL